MDDTGNVIGEWPGSSPEIVMVTAHLDTVFPAGTDVHVKREGGRLLAPGISDNGTGLAALVALSKAFREAKIKTTKTILFVADVGEEGEGNLRGMRALVDDLQEAPEVCPGAGRLGHRICDHGRAGLAPRGNHHHRAGRT